MAELGGNTLDVAYPIAFGDRYVAVRNHRITGALLVDVYRWDHELDRLVVEMFAGQPLPGAPPITVSAAGPGGALRLGTRPESDAVVGYLSGGDDPRSIVIRHDRLEARHGDALIFEMLGTMIQGFDIGVVLDDHGGVAIGAPLPPGFPPRRVFRDASVLVTDLVVGPDPMIVNTDFERCRLIGPAIVAPLGDAVEIQESQFPDAEFLWELPAREGFMVGLIGLAACSIRSCTFDGVGIAVAPGTRPGVRSRMFRPR